jgi:hypothetical protein
MDVRLITALHDYYQFDHPVEQYELRDHLQQALHLNERDAVYALASLIAQDYVRVFQSSTAGSEPRICAMLKPGPRLHSFREEAEATQLRASS